MPLLRPLIAAAALVFVIGTLHAQEDMPPPLPAAPQQATEPQEEVEAPVWHVAVDGQPRGPMTGPELAALVQERGLGDDTLVWREGMADWTPIAEVAELAEIVEADQAQQPDNAEASAPPEIAAADATEYYVAEDGAPVGPLLRDEMERRIAAGTISAETMVWHEGLSEWTPAGSTELSGMLAAAPAPAPEVDPVATIVGTWESEISQPVEGLPAPVPFAVTLNYDSAGTLRGSGSGKLDLSSQGVQQPVTLQLELEGTWSGEAAGDNRVRLTTRATVRMSVPELNIPEETDTYDDVTVIEILDENTLRDEDGTLIRRAGS